MLFRQLFDRESSSYTYLIADLDTGFSNLSGNSPTEPLSQAGMKASQS